MSFRRRFSSFREKSATDTGGTKHHTFSSFRNGSVVKDSNLKRRTSHTKWGYKHGGKILELKYDNGEEVALRYTERETVRFKDFVSEVRGTMDIEVLLEKSVVILDSTETTLDRILETLLEKTLSSIGAVSSYDEAMSSLFLPDSGNILTKTIQGTVGLNGSFLENDQSWLITMATLANITRRTVGIVRLKHPQNLGPGHEETRYIILVLCPTKEKETKSAVETSRTFATIFADINFRNKLLNVNTEAVFRDVISEHARELACLQTHSSEKEDQKNTSYPWYHIGRGLWDDVRGRLPWYWSDFVDGVVGEKALQKTISTTMYLYFACLLPIIALGSLDSQNTGGKIGVMSAIVGQFIGGILFSLLSGQPLVVIMTTAPLALYIKIVKNIATDYEMDFYALYTCVGLWNSFYVIVYALTNAAKVMSWMTRSTEEIFSLFICVAFTVDSVKDTVKEFNKHYLAEDCQKFDDYLAGNLTLNSTTEVPVCLRENSLLFLLLMLGTLWLGLFLNRFTSTPYLQANKREILSDYALPVAVISFSFVGSYLFRAVSLEQFDTKEIAEVFHMPIAASFTGKEILGGFLLGFPLSLLFFIDQNIAASMVNNPDNKLVKGTAYHWDMALIGLLNIIMSVFGLPWLHAVLPHSPLHVRALADIEPHVEQGHVFDIIVKVRETRLSNLISNILIGLSVLLIPRPLNYIPKPVLDGLFLYLAVTALSGNQMFERIMLLVTEQTSYPPSHYIRRVPQRKIHIFTACQVFQLLILCILGFFPWPYIKVIFPVMLSTFMPIRIYLLPKLIEKKYLEVLDGTHQ